MIYNKEVAFPYPILMNGVDNYIDGNFSLDIDVKENVEEFCFEFTFSISSKFINTLIDSKEIEVMLIIQSIDNKFYRLTDLSKSAGVYSGKKIISKKKLSLNKKTRLQVILQATKQISFKSNEDLIKFYDNVKNDILIDKFSVVGISNEVAFDGSQKIPTQLFEKKLDENLKSEIAIELTEECILTKYKLQKFQFDNLNYSRYLNYPYLYMGLQKALMKFILEINNLKDEDFDEPIALLELSEEGLTSLNIKLLKLMLNKGLTEIQYNDIDEIINKISDKIIDNYTQIIERISENGN